MNQQQYLEDVLLSFKQRMEADGDFTMFIEDNLSRRLCPTETWLPSSPDINAIENI